MIGKKTKQKIKSPRQRQNWNFARYNFNFFQKEKKKKFKLIRFHDYHSQELKSLLNSTIQRSWNSLIVGCGNSALAEQMKLDGYDRLIVSIDFAPSCIDTMVERARKFKYDSLKYLIMDARELQFDNNSFDSVIDKGTIDSAFCGAGSHQNVKKIVNEIYRVLKPGGVFISISFGLPDQRKPWFNRPEFEWEMSETVIRREKNGRDTKHYVFILKKKNSTISNAQLPSSSTSAVGGISSDNSLQEHIMLLNQTNQQPQQPSKTSSQQQQQQQQQPPPTTFLPDLNANFYVPSSSSSSSSSKSSNENSNGYKIVDDVVGSSFIHQKNNNNNGGGGSDDSPSTSSPELDI